MEIIANDASHWRAFDNNELSHSMAHYLMAIDSLRSELGYARSTDVAELLSVSRGAASMALQQLKKRGWVAEDPNRFLLLTEEGARIANGVEHNYIILRRFFESVLRVEPDIAASEACKMEHLMSRDTGKRLLSLMRILLDDETLAKRLRQRMDTFTPRCDPESIEACPVCGGTGECLAGQAPGEDKAR